MSSTALDTLNVELTLEELAEAANREHQLSLDAVGVALVHAIRAGEALYEAKRRVDPGTWGRWVEENCNFTTNSADHQIRLAYYQDVLREHANGKPLGVAEGLKALVGQPGVRVHTVIYDRATRERAVELTRGGMNVDDVSSLLGIGKQTIRCWLDPAYRKQTEAKRLKKRRDERQARKAARREQRGKEAKAVGGSFYKGYQHLRWAAQSLDKAQDQMDRREKKAAVRSAITALHRAEDEVDEALRVIRGDAA